MALEDISMILTIWGMSQQNESSWSKKCKGILLDAFTT